MSPLFLAALSGVLLRLAFPRISFDFLAWIALVPWLFAVRRMATGRQAVWSGAVAGLIFFGAGLIWLNYVAFVGWVFVVLLETSFFFVVGYLFWKGMKFPAWPVRVLWVALSWSVMEWVRTEFPIFGFGWNLLGYSQADQPLILQSANTVGIYGVSFLIAFMNGLAFEILNAVDQRRFRRLGAAMAAGVVVMSLVFAHGYYHLGKPLEVRTLRFSVLQGNIPQNLKWDPQARESIIQIYSKLTQLAGLERPDLIVWPEAAFPGYLNEDPEQSRIVELVKNTAIPVLIGAPHLEDRDTAFNSAYLFNAEGQMQFRYDKLYLVPFGEYVPLHPVFSWLEPLAYSLGVSDFSAGKEATIFDLGNGIRFGALICFEDIFPSLALNLAELNAGFLSVITNDAWFGPTAAPYQHLQASIFRAVENGISVVRAANTGVSAFINPRGQVIERVKDSKGIDIFVTGRATAELPVENEMTLYRRGGYLFPYGALLLLLCGLLLLRRRREV